MSTEACGEGRSEGVSGGEGLRGEGFLSISLAPGSLAVDM